LLAHTTILVVRAINLDYAGSHLYNMSMTIARRIYKVKTALTEAQHKRLQSLEFFRGVKVIGWHVEDRAPIVYMPHIGKSFTVTKDGRLRPRRKHGG